MTFESVSLKAPAAEQRSKISACPPELFESIFELHGEALALAEVPSLLLLRVNQKFAELLGLNPAELCGQPLSAIFVGLPQYLVQAISPPPLVVEQRWPHNFHWLLTDVQGHQLWVKASFKELTWESQRFLLLTVRQTKTPTSPLAVQQQHGDLFLALFQALQDIALLLDPSGMVLAANETAARRFQRSVSELVGTNVFDLFPPEVAAFRRQKVQEVLDTGKIIQFEDEFAGRVIGSILYPVFNDQGQVSAIGVYAFDVTAQREAREELQRVKKRLEYLLSHSPAALYSSHCEAKCTFSYLSSNIQNLIGYSAAEILEQPGFWEEHLHPNDLPIYLARKNFVYARSQRTLEYRLRLRNGRYRWLHDEFKLVYDNQGRPLEFVGSLLDITERKAAEEARQQSEYLFRMVAEHSPVGIYVMQGNNFLYVNPRMAEIFGYSPTEMLAQVRPLDLIHPEDRDFFAAKLASHAPEQLYIKGRRRDGQTIHCEIQASRIAYQGQPATLGTLLDVTSRRQAEEAKQQVEQRFRFLIENMNDGLGVADATGRMTYVNPKLCAMLGYKATEILGRPLLDFVDPPQREFMAAQLALRQEGVEAPYEITWLRRDGTKMPSLVSPKAVFASDGSFQGSFGIVTDISARLEVEQALQRREQYFRSLTENVSDLIGLLSPDGTIRYINQAAQDFLGFTAEELTQKNLFILLSSETSRTIRSLIDQLLVHPDRVLVTEAQIRHRDGSWRTWEIKAKNLAADLIVNGIVINARDISMQKQMAQELKEAAAALQLLTQRLLTAQEDERRRLALELHDDLGQCLMVLKLQVRALANKLRRDQTRLRQEFDQTLQYINEVIDKVRRLSHELSPSLLETIGLIPALRLLLEDFRQHYEVDDNLQTVPDFEDRLTLPAKINLYRIFQEIFTNIVKHAQATAIYLRLQPESDRLLITVVDNGQGFPEPLQAADAKDFVGLGLSAIRERVKMLGGTLAIDGRGQGVKFNLSIPWQSKNL